MHADIEDVPSTQALRRLSEATRGLSRAHHERRSAHVRVHAAHHTALLLRVEHVHDRRRGAGAVRRLDAQSEAHHQPEHDLSAPALLPDELGRVGRERRQPQRRGQGPQEDTHRQGRSANQPSGQHRPIGRLGLGARQSKCYQCDEWKCHVSELLWRRVGANSLLQYVRRCSHGLQVRTQFKLDRITSHRIHMASSLKFSTQK